MTGWRNCCRLCNLETEMRTTLAIDDDVLAAARGIAADQRRTVGEVISELARKSLGPGEATGQTRNGVLLLPDRPDGRRVTPELINRLFEAP